MTANESVNRYAFITHAGSIESSVACVTSCASVHSQEGKRLELSISLNSTEAVPRSILVTFATRMQCYEETDTVEFRLYQIR